MTDDRAEIIRTAVRDRLRTETLKDDAPLAQLGLDSLDFFELLVDLEEQHGIDIPIEKLNNDVATRHLIEALDA